MVADAHDEMPEAKPRFVALQRWHCNMKDREGNKILVGKKSNMNHLHASNQVKKEYAKLWSKADECPLFRQKIGQQEDEHGNKIPYKRSKRTKKLITTRGNRALSGHTLKTLASGAAATLGAQLRDDAKLLRLDLPDGGAVEDPKHPMQPSYTMAASFAIESAFVSYVQEIFKTAVDIKDAAGKHSKVTAKVCHAAANIVNRRVAGATSYVPPVISRRGVPEGIKKKKVAKPTAAKENGNP